MRAVAPPQQRAAYETAAKSAKTLVAPNEEVRADR